MKEMKNEVWVCLPDAIHNNYGIEIWCDDCAVVNKFVEVIDDHFPRYFFQPFFQGGSNDMPHSHWAYFEFWRDLSGDIRQSLLLERAEAIANYVGLPLNVK